MERMHWIQAWSHGTIECRMSRAWRPPSDLWFFEPRSDTHGVDGAAATYFEIARGSASAASGLDAVDLRTRAGMTLDLEGSRCGPESGPGPGPGPRRPSGGMDNAGDGGAGPDHDHAGRADRSSHSGRGSSKLQDLLDLASEGRGYSGSRKQRRRPSPLHPAVYVLFTAQRTIAREQEATLSGRQRGHPRWKALSSMMSSLRDFRDVR